MTIIAAPVLDAVQTFDGIRHTWNGRGWVAEDVGGAPPWQANHFYSIGDEFHARVAGDGTIYGGVDFTFRVIKDHTSPAAFDPSADNPPWYCTSAPVYVGETANANLFPHGSLWYQASTASLSLLDKQVPGGWVKIVR